MSYYYLIVPHWRYDSHSFPLRRCSLQLQSRFVGLSVRIGRTESIDWRALGAKRVIKLGEIN